MSRMANGVTLKRGIDGREQAEDTPTAIGEAGSIGDSRRGNVCIFVQIERHRSISEHSPRCLRDEHAGQTAPLLGRLHGNRQLVSIAVVLLATDPRREAPSLVPGNKDVPVERTQPDWQARIVRSHPFTDVGQRRRALRPSKDGTAEGQPGLTEHRWNRHSGIRGPQCRQEALTVNGSLIDMEARREGEHSSV